MRTTLRCWLTLSLVSGLSACTLFPLDYDQLWDIYQPVTMAGFARYSGSSLVVEAYNHKTRQFDSIAAFVADTQGPVWGGRDLYPWYGEAPIAVAVTSATLCRWSPKCNTLSPLRARLRIREVYPTGQRVPLAALTPAGINCLSPKAGDGTMDPALVYLQCMGKPLIEIRLRGPA